MTKYNHTLEEFKADWRKWQVKILRLLEKEASSIVTEEDLTGLYSWLFLCSYVITRSTYILSQMIMEFSVCICLTKSCTQDLRKIRKAS